MALLQRLLVSSLGYGAIVESEPEEDQLVEKAAEAAEMELDTVPVVEEDVVVRTCLASTSKKEICSFARAKLTRVRNTLRLR